MDTQHSAIEGALVLSTRHIPTALGKLGLDCLDSWFIVTTNAPRVVPHKHGWVVFIDGRKWSVPPWFQPILDLAQKLEASFIVFDKDGHVLPSELDMWEW